MKKAICMIGPDKNLKGGIATVINQYSKSDMNLKYDFKFISSYSYNKFEFLKGIIEYLNLLVNHKIDLTHIHVASNGSFFRKSIFVFLTPKSIPIILHIHGGGFLDFYSTSNGLVKFIIRKVLNKSKHIIVISEKFKQCFFNQFKLNEKKITKIYNGINIIDKKINVKSKKNQVLYMGKLTQGKGIYDFIKSIPMIHEKSPETVFIIAGDGEIEEVKKIVTKNDMEKYVRVVGWISGKQKDRYLLESRILVMPSYFEAFGISIVEAMQYGLTIVATNVGGIPEIIQQNINGMLVNKGDINALSEALIYYINNDDIRIKTSEANINRCKDFDINIAFRKTEQIYQGYLKNNK